MLRQAARGLLRTGASRSICSSSAVWQETSEQSKEVRGRGSSGGRRQGPPTAAAAPGRPAATEGSADRNSTACLGTNPCLLAPPGSVAAAAAMSTLGVSASLPPRQAHPAARTLRLLAPPPQDFLKLFAPHQGMLNPPEFPSNYLPKAAAAAEGAAAGPLPEKLQFNFFVPHETLCQSEKVRVGGVGAAARVAAVGWVEDGRFERGQREPLPPGWARRPACRPLPPSRRAPPPPNPPPHTQRST